MNITQLELETVTPMFLRGADNRTPELRPPAFKALFRYWWRTVQDYDTDKLRKEEAKLFGSTDGKAPFSIRTLGTTKLDIIREKPLPHHQGGWNCLNCPPGERCKKGDKNKAYAPDQQLTIRLAAPDLKYYEKIAELSFLLGGVGNRSRRGFGSIRETCWSFADVSYLKKKVLDTLNNVADVGSSKRFKIDGKLGIIELEKPYSTLPQYPVIETIGFGKPTTDVGCLLKRIGQATHNHNYDALGYAEGRERLASPVHVRVQKVGKKYVPVVTLLRWNYPGETSSDLKKQFGFIAEIIKWEFFHE